MDYSEIEKKVNEYISSNSKNVLLDIIYDTKTQTETYKIFKYIFENKIITDKNLINEALYNSVYNGLYIIVKSLLKYGKADPNYVNGEFTMIDLACDFYYILTAKILYKYGGRGYIWCQNEKSCKEFLESYSKDNQDNEDFINKKGLNKPFEYKFNNNKFDKKNSSDANQKIKLNLDNIVIY